MVTLQRWFCFIFVVLRLQLDSIFFYFLEWMLGRSYLAGAEDATESQHNFQIDNHTSEQAKKDWEEDAQV